MCVRYAKNTQPNFLDFRFTSIVIFGKITNMNKMPSEIEKKMLEKDTALLVMATIVVMVVVALTMAIAPKEHRVYTSECFEVCKEHVNQKYNFENGELKDRAKFVIEVGECMDDCKDFKEAIDEDEKNKSMAN